MLKVQVLLVVMLLGILSCSSYTVLKKSSQPKEGKAYLFGEFSHTGNTKDVRAHFTLENLETEEEIDYRVNPASPVVLIEVEPGNYRLADFYVETSFKDPELKPFLPASCPKSLKSGFEVKPGQAVYLGYHGVNTKIGQSFNNDKHMYYINWNWNFQPSRYDFDSGSRNFNETYGNFDGLDLVDLSK